MGVSKNESKMRTAKTQRNAEKIDLILITLFIRRIQTISFMKQLAIFVLVIISVDLVAQVSGNDMMSLAQIKTGMRSKRISSYDRSGNNNDRIEAIKPGEKKTLFEVTGAGMINHIWITIAPEPQHLNRNDIILRMYWDGNTFPSVESPIGPFFGQGWNEEYLFLSQPLTATPVGGRALVSYFVMPFSKGARIEVENQGDKN